MINQIYQLLEQIGFTHPLHPAMTHIPMGMVMGSCAFTASYIVLRKPDLLKTAHYCVILALLGVVPTAVLGFMDWQYKFEGEWSGIILTKIILFFVFTFLLFVTYQAGRRENTAATKYLILNTLLLANAIGLGFMGGELQYG
jgi:uncharacterized membrane protein